MAIFASPESKLLVPQLQEPPHHPDRVQAQKRAQGPGITQRQPHCIHQLLLAQGLCLKQRHSQTGGDTAADVQLGPVLMDPGGASCHVQTVLSHFLFTIYTSDFSFNPGTCHLQKFSDDSSIVGCISEDGEEYRGEPPPAQHRQDQGAGGGLSTEQDAPIPITIQGDEIEMVDSYRFLVVHINNKLDWTDNTEGLYRKGQSRLFFLRRLRSFDMCSRLLKMFYQSVVASTLFFAVACWGGGIKAGETNRLNKLVRKASSVVGLELDSLEAVAERRMRDKIKTSVNFVDEDYDEKYQKTVTNYN
ncbi:hypothetical protein N1851_006440 [Merluccius polli]|uniref:Alkylated DNA repair protein AlkB homologue 8 N-terminal domain-containing protein n=1 Tax=Merluccius polli TaxID=89951 RepID=A0AA47N5Y1_MERPO|nr:hypothetical protein N1851_006440 [Merluccius polli]